MTNIAITVIIPTYKPGSYIYECLDSLKKQTLGHDCFETIVVLNGGKAPYYEQLEQYVKTSGQANIRLIYTEESGVSNARNVALDAAEGRYIAFVDDDDWLSPDYLEALLKVADTDTVAASNIISVNDSTGENEKFYLSDAYDRLSGQGRLSVARARSFMSPACGKLISRETIKDSRFPTDFSLGEDSLFLFDISRRVSHIALTPPTAVYYYRNRQQSATRKSFSYALRVRLALRMIKKFTSIWLQSPASYNFIFFLTRIAAQLRKLTQKKYQ